MVQVEKIKALIREMMDQEMENYKDAVSLGMQYETSAPVVYTMLQVLLTKIEKMPNEPVNEDLEKEVYEHLWKGRMGADVSKPIYFSYDELLEVARHFANWQKQIDNNNANHALVEQIKTQQMCYEKGMADMKQQMMATAIEVTIAIPYQNGDGGYTQLVYSKEALPFGEQLKVLVIKED